MPNRVVANLAQLMLVYDHMKLYFELYKFTRCLICTGSTHITLYLQLVKNLLLMGCRKTKVLKDVSLILFIISYRFSYSVINGEHLIVLLQEQHCLLFLV